MDIMATHNTEATCKLNKGFEADDASAILSCLADDIRWDVAGAFTTNGKDEFRKQIHNENFVGAPTITIKNEIAEGNYVAVEGELECTMKTGNMFQAYFHNTYLLENEKDKRMTSYLAPKAQ